MAGWLRRVFGGDAPRASGHRDDEYERTVQTRLTSERLWNQHERISTRITSAMKRDDFDAALAECRKLWEFIPRFHDDPANRHDGLFVCDGVIEAAEISALRENIEGLDEIVLLIKRTPQMKRYYEYVEPEYTTLQQVAAVRRAVEKYPGIKQTDVKKHVLGIDGRRVAKLSALMERHRRLRREKVGNSYRLYPVETAVIENPDPTGD